LRIGSICSQRQSRSSTREGKWRKAGFFRRGR
jgi:hypothetical protein